VLYRAPRAWIKIFLWSGIKRDVRFLEISCFTIKCTCGPINENFRGGRCHRVCILTMKSPFRQCLLLLSDYSGRYSRPARRFLRAVICNLCNTWKSDATIITRALIRYYLLCVTIGSSLFCMDMIKTRLRIEIAFYNGRWFTINEFIKRYVASNFLITFHWNKPYLPLWLRKRLIGSFVTNCRYIIQRCLFNVDTTMQVIFSPRLKSQKSKRDNRHVKRSFLAVYISPLPFERIPKRGRGNNKLE